MDNDTKEIIGDLTEHNMKLLVAKVVITAWEIPALNRQNRAPRQTNGTPGENVIYSWN